MKTIVVKAKVCDGDHGAPNNAATVYGHFGSLKTCVRIGMSNVWVHDLTRSRTQAKKARGKERTA